MIAERAGVPKQHCQNYLNGKTNKMSQETIKQRTTALSLMRRDTEPATPAGAMKSQAAGETCRRNPRGTVQVTTAKQKGIEECRQKRPGDIRCDEPRQRPCLPAGKGYVGMLKLGMEGFIIQSTSQVQACWQGIWRKRKEAPCHLDAKPC